MKGYLPRVKTHTVPGMMNCPSKLASSNFKVETRHQYFLYFGLGFHTAQVQVVANLEFCPRQAWHARQWRHQADGAAPGLHGPLRRRFCWQPVSLAPYFHRNEFEVAPFLPHRPYCEGVKAWQRFVRGAFVLVMLVTALAPDEDIPIHGKHW